MVLEIKEEDGWRPHMHLPYSIVATLKHCIISKRPQMSFPLFVPPGSQTEECPRWVLAQTSPLKVQSGLSKVLHEGLSCAAMGPHPEKGEGIRWVSETNATEICMARQCSGRPRTATSAGTTHFK